jgi:8-amino-7-oxononanoate synthase
LRVSDHRGHGPLPPSALDRHLRATLARARAQSLYRVRRTVRGPHGIELEVDGRRCVSFCSNDYLGLAADPRVAQAAQRALETTGTGSGASALVSGYNAEHRLLEEALAEFTQRPRALLFGSGWAANVGVLRALLGRGDTLVADELNHASLIDGGRLSGARYVRAGHADAGAVEAALRAAPRDGLRLVATDSVFSMDGDLAPLASLAATCRAHDAALMVDDAHGFGVLGAHGRGAAEEAGVTPDIYVATLGKALGVAGAFVAGSEELVEFLIQRARSWVFSTAPPPALAAAARCALGILRAEPQRRERLHALVRRLRDGAAERGIALAPSKTPIQPLILGDEARALALSAELLRRGFWVTAIRPPTVPPGTARLRITVSAAHTEAHVDGLLDALAAGLRDLARAA